MFTSFERSWESTAVKNVLSLKVFLYSWYHDHIDTDLKTKIEKKSLKSKQRKIYGDSKLTSDSNLTRARTRAMV